MVEYEWVVFGGWFVVEVGPPSRRTNIMGITEYVFTSELDAKRAAKENGGTWAKRRRHKTRKVELKRGRELLKGQETK
jgi:hypothetical protein